MVTTYILIARSVTNDCDSVSQYIHKGDVESSLETWNDINEYTIANIFKANISEVRAYRVRGVEFLVCSVDHIRIYWAVDVMYYIYSNTYGRGRRSINKL